MLPSATIVQPSSTTQYPTISTKIQLSVLPALPTVSAVTISPHASIVPIVFTSMEHNVWHAPSTVNLAIMERSVLSAPPRVST